MKQNTIQEEIAASFPLAFSGNKEGNGYKIEFVCKTEIERAIASVACSSLIYRSTGWKMLAKAPAVNGYEAFVKAALACYIAVKVIEADREQAGSYADKLASKSEAGLEQLRVIWGFTEAPSSNEEELARQFAMVRCAKAAASKAAKKALEDAADAEVRAILTGKEA